MPEIVNLRAKIKKVKLPLPSFDSVSFNTTNELPHTMVTINNNTLPKVAFLSTCNISHRYYTRFGL